MDIQPDRGAGDMCSGVQDVAGTPLAVCRDVCSCCHGWCGRSLAVVDIDGSTEFSPLVDSVWYWFCSTVMGLC